MKRRKSSSRQSTLPIAIAFGFASGIAAVPAFASTTTTIAIQSDGECFDIPSSSTATGAIVQQWACNGTGAQNYSFTLDANGYYVIQNVNSNLCLDITGGAGATANGVKLEQWTCNGGTNQEFSLNAASSSSYSIVARNSGKCLDIANSSATEGVQIEQWDCNGGANQTFNFANNPVKPPSSTIVAENSGKCLDTLGSAAWGAPVDQETCSSGDNSQKYNFTLDSNGYYVIQNVNSGLCMDVTSSGTANGVHIQQYGCNGTEAQEFKLTPAANGTYQIIARISGRCMDIAGGSTSNGVQLEQWDCWSLGTSNQTFAIAPSAIPSPSSNSSGSGSSGSSGGSGGPTPSAPATIAQIHWLTYIQRQGCFHNTDSGSYSNKSDCVSPLAGPNATPAQVQSDYNTLAKYVDFWEGDQNAATYAIPAGIQMGMYTDPMFLHGNDLNAPNAAIAHYVDGARVGMNRNPGGSYLGEMTSSTLYQYEKSLIQNVMDNGAYKYSWVRMDDMAYPGWEYSWIPFVENLNLTGPKPPVSSYAFFSFGSYPKPFASAWVSGVQALFNYQPVKVVFNNYYDPTYAQIFTPNVVAAQCEGCVTQQNENNWVNQVNAEYLAQTRGVIFHVFNGLENGPSDTTFLYASMMLGMYDPKLVMLTESMQNSAYDAPSLVQASPLYYIVPTQPLGANIGFDPIASNYNPNSPPSSVGVKLLKSSGGAYAREFAACYVKGKLVSACAAVVNPTSSTAPMPTLSTSYAHTAVVSGNGVISEFGDNGSLSVTGPAAGSSLAPGAAVILFK